MRLNIIGPDDPALDVLKTAIAKQPKLDINLTTIPWSDYRDTMLSTLKSTLAPNQAVFVPGHIWIPELAHAGYLAKLDPILTQVPSAIIQKYDADDIVPSISSECQYLGNQYQLSFFTDGHILFYRENIIKINDDKIPVISTQSRYFQNTLECYLGYRHSKQPTRRNKATNPLKVDAAFRQRTGQTNHCPCWQSCKKKQLLS